MRFAVLLSFTAFLCLASCDRSTGHHVERFEVDGIPVIRTTGGPKYDTPLFELESDLLLGVDEGEPEWQMFTVPPYPLIAPDGTMVLVDQMKFDIFIVSKEGELLAQLGGKGSGPGEFQDILGFFWAVEGREFWLMDQLNNRISRISLEGDYLGGISFSKIQPLYNQFYHLKDGLFLAEGRISDSPDRSINRKRFALIDDQLEIVKVLFEIEGVRLFQSRGTVYSTVPYASGDRVTPFPDGRIVISQPGIPRLSIFSTEGELQRHVERDWEYIPVTQEEKNNAERSWRERGRLEPGRRIPFPDFKPPFRMPYLDTEGRIWLEMYEAVREEGTEDEPGQFIGYRYEIYSADGIWLGEFIHRATLQYITGEFLYQTFFSDAGAPRFERVRIIPLVPEMEPGR